MNRPGHEMSRALIVNQEIDAVVAPNKRLELRAGAAGSGDEPLGRRGRPSQLTRGVESVGKAAL